MSDFWICDIHGEYGPSSFNRYVCSECAKELYKEKCEDALENDFQEWRYLMEMKGETMFVEMQGHGYLPMYHFGGN